MKRYRGWWTRFWQIIPSLLTVRKIYKASWSDMITTADIVRQMHASLPQFLTGMEMYRRAFLTGDIKRAYSPAGQVVGRIEDIPTCREVIHRTAIEAEEIISNLHKKCLS